MFFQKSAEPLSRGENLSPRAEISLSPTNTEFDYYMCTMTEIIMGKCDHVFQFDKTFFITYRELISYIALSVLRLLGVNFFKRTKNRKHF